MKHLRVNDEQYNDLIERLILKVDEDGYQFDSLLCLARGGMRVGDLFSRVHNMPLAVMATSSYREEAGRVQGDLDIASFITKTGGEIAGKLLLVDDMVDSGKTIVKVVEHLKKAYPAVTDVRVAVLWWKSHSAFKPDYYVDYLEDNPWIHQPFEIYDDLGIEELRKKRGE